MPPGRGRTYSSEQNERIRAAAQELLGRYGSQANLAASLGLKQPSLSSYLLGRYNAGPHLMKRVAELRGMTVDELLGETQTVEPVDRYSNRTMAVRVARLDGLAEPAVQAILSVVLQSERDLPIIEWIDAIRDEVRRQQRFASEPERTSGPAAPLPASKPDVDATTSARPMVRGRKKSGAGLSPVARPRRR